MMMGTAEDPAASMNVEEDPSWLGRRDDPQSHRAGGSIDRNGLRSVGLLERPEHRLSLFSGLPRRRRADFPDRWQPRQEVLDPGVELVHFPRGRGGRKEHAAEDSEMALLPAYGSTHAAHARNLA